MKTSWTHFLKTEDAPKGDITSLAIFGRTTQTVKAKIIARQELVLSGVAAVQMLLKKEFPALTLIPNKQDGSFVKKGAVIALLSGPVTELLQAERLCLNILQRLSGVATLTASCVAVAKSYATKILDTRKTTPGWRVWEKKAVTDGGGYNHRMNLSDQYLIKDNHIDAAGGVIEAIVKVRAHQKKSRDKVLLEVEVRDDQEFCEALLLKPDIILLDNMRPTQIRRMVRMRNEQYPKGKRPLLEISGGVTLKNLKQYAQLGVERISMGAITHSATAVDISMTIK